MALATAILLSLPALGSGALAKDGGMVRVDPPIDLGAVPGTTMEVHFEPFQVLDGGVELAWTGTPFVVRLFPVAAAASMSRIHAKEQPAGSGRYVATITVPDSGLVRVEIGLLGESCVNGECTISDLPFELTEGSVVAALPPVAAPIAPEVVAQTNETPTVPAIDVAAPSAISMGVLALALMVGIAITLGALRLRPGLRSRPPAPDR